MAKRNVNRETLLAVKLSQLRRHMMTCAKCKGATNAEDYDMLCDVGRKSIIEIAVKWENNISARMRAAHNRDGYMFPCPDTSAHGPAYAISAEPVIVMDTQGRLL